MCRILRIANDTFALELRSSGMLSIEDCYTLRVILN